MKRKAIFPAGAFLIAVVLALLATVGLQGSSSGEEKGEHTLVVEFHSTFATNYTRLMAKGERKYGEGDLFVPGEGPDGEPIGTWQFTEVATEPIGTAGGIHTGVFRIFDEGEIFVSSLTEVVDGFFTHNGAITGGTGKFAGADGTFTNLQNKPQLIEFVFMPEPTHESTTYYACVNEKSGTIKMVDEGESCKKKWEKISWNSEGPNGPPGPEGPPGPPLDSYCELENQLAELVPGFEVSEKCMDPDPPHEEVDVQLIRKDVYLFGELGPIGFLDSDADGLTDKQEDMIGTDSGWWDSDGDGVGDGEEFHGNTNPNEPGGDPVAPVDGDEDGLTDFQESLIGTAPDWWDTDDDEISDTEEFFSDSDPLDGGSQPQPPPAIPVGTEVDLLIEAEVRVDGEVIPEDATEFPVPVRMTQELVVPPDCQVGFRLPDEWPESVKDVWFMAVYADHDEEVLPVDGFVTKLPGSDGLRLGLLVAMWPGETFGLTEDWSVQCDNTSYHELTLYGSVWAEDDRTTDRDHGNNNLRVALPLAVIAEVNVEAAGMDVAIYGEPFGEPDSDGDDLLDRMEAFIGTDPANPDTDEDGFEDGREFWENADPLTKGFEPVPWTNGDADTLSDHQEALIGTDPTNEDTDGDGPWDDHEFFQADPLDNGIQPGPLSEAPVGEVTVLEVGQDIAVAEETFPEGLGQIDVWVQDTLRVEENGTAIFFVTQEFLALTDDWFLSAHSESDWFELVPENGVATAPPGYSLTVNFMVGVTPGTALFVPQQWGVGSDAPGHHYVSLVKTAWPGDEHVIEVDPRNNRFTVAGPIVFIGP